MATKQQIKEDYAKIYISATFNNTIVTLTNKNGDVLLWGSAGASGFKGTRKSTPFAATTAVDKIMSRAKNDLGIKEAEIYIKGPGPGRDASLRSIKSSGIKITQIADITPFPHNGPRSKKKRRQ